MDDSCVEMAGSLQSLKGKAWSSLQQLFASETSSSLEESPDDFNDDNIIGHLTPLHNGQCSSSSPPPPPSHPSSSSLTLNRIKNQVNGETENRSPSVLNRSKSDSMKLKREDMCLYGHRPAFDPFYLVVCEHCGHVIKPQALSKHIELRHRPKKKGGLTQVHNKSALEQCIGGDAHSSQNGPTSLVTHCDPSTGGGMTSISQPASIVSSISTSNTGDSNMSSSGSGLSAYPSAGESNLKALLSNPSVSISYSPHPDSLLDLDQSKNLPKTTSISTRTSLRPSSSMGVSFNQSTLSSTDSLPSVIGSGSSGGDTSGKKNASRTKLLPCKDRKYDPDRHCGVRLNDQDQPCTRSLTCKTHSLTLRRSVTGRSDLFDTLLNQHRLEKEAAMRAAGIEVKPTKQQLKQQQKLQKELASSSNQQHRSNKNRASATGTSGTDASLISASTASASSSATLTPGRSHLLAQLQSPVATPITSGTSSMIISPVKQSPRPNQLTPSVNSASLQQSSFQSMFVSHSSNVDVRPSPLISSNNSNQACLKSSSTSSPSSLDTNSTLHCSKLLLQKLSGKLNNRAAAAAAAVQQQQNCAADLLFGSEPNYCDSTQQQPVNADQLYLLSCHPRPAALCTYNARQVRFDHAGSVSGITNNNTTTTSSSGSVSSATSAPLLSSRLFNRKQDFAYSALAVFRSASSSPSVIGRSVPSMSDEMQFDNSLQSCSNQSSSGGVGGGGGSVIGSGAGGCLGDQSNSNTSTSIHSTNGTEKCFVNIFNTSVPNANLFSNM